jgi:hypothetical protein
MLHRCYFFKENASLPFLFKVILPHLWSSVDVSRLCQECLAHPVAGSAYLLTVASIFTLIVSGTVICKKV